MTLRVPLSLPILHHSDETIQFDRLEMEYPQTDCDVRTMRFFDIDAVGTFLDAQDNDKDYAKLYLAGSCYIVNMTTAEFNELIDKTQANARD